jgi:hypothetical protein
MHLEEVEEAGNLDMEDLVMVVMGEDMAMG